MIIGALTEGLTMWKWGAVALVALLVAVAAIALLPALLHQTGMSAR